MTSDSASPGVQPSPSQRDAATLRILGLFFLVLGALVLIASLWTLSNPRALVVNLCSGGVILGVGIVMRFIARRFARAEKSELA